MSDRIGDLCGYLTRPVGGDSGMINAEAMNSVTEKRQRRRSNLTKDVMAGIPVLVHKA